MVAGDELFHAVDRKPKSSTDLKRLRNIEATGSVSVLCDHFDEDWTRLWWARADGRAEVWNDGPRRAPVIRLLCEKYPQYAREPPDGPVVAVAVARWSGWSAA